MEIFVVQADRGAFLARGEHIVRLPEQTDFYLFASSKNEAKQLSLHYIADKIGHGSSIQHHAIFDDVSDCVNRADANQYLSIVENTIADVARFIGTIQIESYAVISPEHDENTLIVSLAEGNKRRCLLRKIHFMENGSVEWGDEMIAFDVVALATAIQALF